MDELTALNVWIAEHIWNWNWKPLYNAFRHIDGKWLYNPDGRIQEIPHYSANLLLAWGVLQECQRHHVYLAVEAAMPQGYYGRAQITATADEQGFSASTAPELICHMAKWAYEKLGADGWRDSFNPVYKVM